MTWDTNPQGQGTDYAPELHARTHRKRANDYLPHFLSEDEELGAPVAEGDIIRALVAGGRLQWQRSVNLYITGAARIGSATEPFNHASGDVTVGGILSVVTNAAPASGVKMQVTGSTTVSGYSRVGALTAPTNTTVGDVTCIRVLAGDATLASGVVAAFAGNQTTTGWLNVGVSTAPSNTTSGDLTAKRAHFGTDGAFSSGKELEVTGDALVSLTFEVGTTSHLIGKVTADGEVQIGGDLNHDGTNVGLYSHAPSAQGTGGQNVTNNVNDGGGSTNGVIPNFTDGIVWANDATNVKYAIFQLARMLKQDHDQLRAMGILT